jgi:hypothetical protein
MSLQVLYTETEHVHINLFLIANKNFAEDLCETLVYLTWARSTATFLSTAEQPCIVQAARRCILNYQVKELTKNYRYPVHDDAILILVPQIIFNFIITDSLYLYLNTGSK